MGAGQGGPAVNLPGERRRSRGKHRGGFGQHPGECHNFVTTPPLLPKKVHSHQNLEEPSISFNIFIFKLLRALESWF